MISQEAYQRVADRLGVSVAAVQAVSDVESSGVASWTIDGEQRPPIRLEAHWFGKLTDYRYNDSHPSISCTNWTPGLAATSAAGAWAQFEQAKGLDPAAAIQATSWGAFQIMGFHYARLKYATPDDFVAAMSTADGQLEAFARFIEADPALKAALSIGAWLDFERRYNGGGFNGAYAAKIAAAFERHGGVVT